MASMDSVRTALTMRYCPPNVTIDDVWERDGISQCFMETFSSVTIGAFLLVFGFVQIMYYKRYSTRAVELAPSKLLQVQLLCTFLMPVLAVTRFLLQDLLYHDTTIYGYMLVTLVMTLLMYSLSALLILMERRYLLTSGCKQGHGMVLIIFWMFIFLSENLSFMNIKKGGWWWGFKDLKDTLEMTLFVARYVICFALLVLGVKAPGITYSYQSLDDEDEIEHQNTSTFRDLFAKLRYLLPFLWPHKNRILQLFVFISIVTLVLGRVVNIYLPIFNKKIVDNLTQQPTHFFQPLIWIYVMFMFLHGAGETSGFLSTAGSVLWIKIEQYTGRELQLRLFMHLHELPLQWHLSRKSGEVLRVMDRGVDAVDTLLWYIVFMIMPTIVDVTIAVVFFFWKFDMQLGFVISFNLIIYIVVTVIVSEWRAKFQRGMNDEDNEQRARSVDSLLNYETVKYYGAEKYEADAYREIIKKYQKEEAMNMASMYLLSAIQNFIVCCGLLVGSLVCISMVSKSELTVGDYVLLTSYMLQLYGPLDWLASNYRQIQKYFVDMEQMFDLLQAQSDVRDAEDATDLQLHEGGAVEFKNVTFGYTPERVVLKDVSFKVPAGKTVALVGPSGSGKTTTLRLLFRFFDVSEGAVLVDGQDVRTVTQKSLRACIGVVPQDTVLFNNTLGFNIQYGRPTATTADVISAAKNADIHERILTYPEGYETQVGERGLRLSGGEKQRVAIARTILKDPAIVLLDEATSALDTTTERNIQAALARVCANRTTIIIAHRLSTVIHADQILVFSEGEIVETGSHETLLAQEGIYASLWHQQLENPNSTLKPENQSDLQHDENLDTS